MSLQRSGDVPGPEAHRTNMENVTARHLLQGLGWLDRLLSLFIILAMIIGVVIGEFAPNVQENLSKGSFKGVSAPLVVGLLVMMWPILTKVSFEPYP